MDSAQTEQELQQRQGVAKEDTLPPVENVDLQYVPPTQQILYAPPKPTLNDKMAPFTHYLKVFFPEILIFAAFIIVFVIALNYFNFLPLSTMYPKTFGLLPHRYDVEGSKKALASVPYSSVLEGYELDGKFYRARGARILVEYDGKLVEFLRTDGISCNSEKINKVTDGTEESLIYPAFCSDLLSEKSRNKNVYINFKRSNGGVNYIHYIVIKN